MPLNIREALRDGAGLLKAAGSDEAELEAELLLMHALGLDRTHLYQRLGEPVPPARERRFRRLLERRLAHEPTAYIVGHREFFGLAFEVTPAAIIPRPETETLIELLIALARERVGDRPFTVADVGVGCGAIAVAVAHALPNGRVIAVDVSKRALTLARRNAERHGIAGRIEFRHGDLLSPLDGRVDAIAANLPYVRTGDWERQPPEVREHEPRRGLDGGPDGLRLVRRLLRRAPAYLDADGALFAEIGEEQGAAAAAIAARCFPDAGIEVRRDLAGLDRVLVIAT